jgi:Protein of unknown function (DUF2924)
MTALKASRPPQSARRRVRSGPPATSLADEFSPSPGSIVAELAELERASLDDLHLRWRNHWGRLAPAHLSRHLLFRLMAYRLQAEAFGDLPRETVRTLDRLASARAERLTPNPSQIAPSNEGGSAAAPRRQLGDPLVLKPGALLVREWQGRLEHVTVLNHGFAWNGETYSSLSAVAFAITGTKWSGHRFFGVRQQDRTRPSDRNAGGDSRRSLGRKHKDTDASSPADRSPFSRPIRKTPGAKESVS